jgi:hypothetical protein
VSEPLTHLRGPAGATLCGKRTVYGDDNEGNVEDTKYVSCPRCLALIYSPTMMSKRNAA